MLGIHVARQLKAAGVTWKPRLGDRFGIPDRDLDDEVFVLSNMTVQVHDRPEGRVIGFNGTTEWALDDVEIDETVWLPREDQLRELLGGTFRSLDHEAAAFRVRMELLGETLTFTAPTADEAYAAALLRLLAAVT
ncbi:pilus assembly protein CpaE [Actinoplanes awajinensis]|uniref:Pilus assembly protein CpaE n=1 Tax=Actinoplanes awajinensis subsp. mycoplanecinus TaxID=135947 RepID=A0A117MPS8_9ACTN|nr:pilus assembly protein CpaE [Actinoplanes awajinensis]KUL29066.1 pilus assembly protein CpaE [Actinoplanes awajinensis subsp. mycoplanecinus]